MKKIDIKKAIKNSTIPLITIYSIMLIILVCVVAYQSKPAFTENEKIEMKREYVIEYFVLEEKVIYVSGSTQKTEYIPTNTTYKKVEAYNSWAASFETYDGKLNPDFEPITVDDVTMFSDKMQNFFDVMSKHDLLEKVIEDEVNGVYTH